MRKRPSPIRTIAVPPAPPARSRMATALVWLLSHRLPRPEPRTGHDDLARLDPDQRVRALGEW